jgi:hyperosmotically inducible protein
MIRINSRIVWAVIAGIAVTACNQSDQEKLRSDATQAWKDAKQAARSATEEVRRETREATAEARQSLKQAGETTGQIVEDAALTAKVKAALIAEKNVKSSRIDVDAFQGKVILRGTVPERRQVELAAKVAGSVDGVKAIDNRLTVN